MNIWHHSSPNEKSIDGCPLKSGHITLADVAEKAGVSVSTASRALAGLGVNKKNQSLVQKAADELGYVMNEAARSLRNVKTMTIGLVFHELTGQFGIELLSAISSRFDQHGYCVFVATAQGDSDRYDKLVHRFLERRVDALLCVHGAGSGSALDRFRSAGIPVIGLISKKGGYADLPLLQPNADAAIKQCVVNLQELGHSNAMVLRHSSAWFAVESFVKFARSAGMKVQIEALPDGPFDPIRMLELCRTGKSRPTVIVSTQVEIAQLLAAADQIKLEVPGDISLVAVRDRSTMMFSTRLPLSMIYLDPQKIGATAVDKLVEQLAGGDGLESDEAVEMGSWLARNTTGVVKK